MNINLDLPTCSTVTVKNETIIILTCPNNDEFASLIKDIMHQGLYLINGWADTEFRTRVELSTAMHGDINARGIAEAIACAIEAGGYEVVRFRHNEASDPTRLESFVNGYG